MKDKEFSYEEVVKELDLMYGPGRQAENYLMELRNRRTEPKETLRELGLAIRELAMMVYPDFSSKGQKENVFIRPPMRTG